LPYTDVRSLAVSGTNLFAGTYGAGVFLSTNNGTSWTAVNTGLTNTYVGSLAVSGTNLFAGTYGNVFLSTDNGTSWSAVNTGLTYPYVYSLAVSGTNLFAGTHGGGVWRRPLSEMTDVEQTSTAVPRTFSLEQNYPNPFNPGTTIGYELPKSAMVTLSVYDILGREVSVLVNERKNAGSYTVKFDASGLANGMYFYQLQAGDFVSVKKLVVLR
jgi:hypothetical protein